MGYVLIISNVRYFVVNYFIYLYKVTFSHSFKDKFFAFTTYDNEPVCIHILEHFGCKTFCKR